MSLACMRSRRVATAWKVPPQTRSEARAGAVAAPREHRLHAAQHLGGGAAGEREQEDAPRVGAARDELGDAVDERGRLAGAGAGDDEQRPVAVLGGGELLGVELHEHGESSSVAALRLAPAPGRMRTHVRGRHVRRRPSGRAVWWGDGSGVRDGRGAGPPTGYSLSQMSPTSSNVTSDP